MSGSDTLATLRRTIREIVPDALDGISYRVPAFRRDGKVVAGFAAFKDHLSYLPFSGPALASIHRGGRSVLSGPERRMTSCAGL